MARRVLVPEGIKLYLNGELLSHREPVATFEASLPTEIADDEGYLRRTKRITVVELHLASDKATIYELGIPVVEVEGSHHIDVRQKVPLNVDRDNVTPGYLQQLRALALNAVHDQLSEEELRGGWVNDAMESEHIANDSVTSVVTARYGENRVIRDPSDPEGTKLAMAKGYSVIEPRSFNKAQWQKIHAAEAALPAGQVTPSKLQGDPSLASCLPHDEWSDGMLLFQRWATLVVKRLLDRELAMRIINEPRYNVLATWATGAKLCINLAGVGRLFFDGRVGVRQLDLLLHEMAHEHCSDHLSSQYNDALSQLGARLAFEAARDPGLLATPDSATK
jgi:hypothetical protein